MQLSKVKTENDAHIMMTRSLRHGCFSVCVSLDFVFFFAFVFTFDQLVA